MITSTSNAQVKALSKLIKNARARRQQQVYIVEGIRMFREIGLKKSMHPNLL